MLKRFWAWYRKPNYISAGISFALAVSSLFLYPTGSFGYVLGWLMLVLGFMEVGAVSYVRYLKRKIAVEEVDIGAKFKAAEEEWRTNLRPQDRGN